MTYEEALVELVIRGRIGEDGIIHPLALLNAITTEIVCPQTGALLDRRTALLIRGPRTGRVAVLDPSALNCSVAALRQAGVEVVDGSEIDWSGFDALVHEVAC